MAAPNLKEAQKGVYAAAIIRFIVVPTIIVVPGIISYKLYGDINDAAYGTLVGDVLPSWLSGVLQRPSLPQYSLLTTVTSTLRLHFMSAIYTRRIFRRSQTLHA